MFQPTEVSLKDIIALQQANDLLKIWSVEYPSVSEAISDSELFFDNRFDLEIGGIVVRDSKLSGESITTTAILLDDFLIERKFVIRVYTG